MGHGHQAKMGAGASWEGTLVTDTIIEYEQLPTGGISLTLRVDPEVAEGWRVAAKRNGLSLIEWISLSLTLADKLSLVDGYEKTPSIGRRLDPVLARAILENAQGKDWEHRAMLLLGMANPMPDEVERTAKRRKGRVSSQVSGLFTQYGIPFIDVAPNYYAVLGDKVLSWQELALVLTLWDESQFDWAYLSYKGLQERTGMTHHDTRKATERAVAQELVERDQVSAAMRGRTVLSRTRVTRPAGEALLRGDLRPATVDDSFSESYLTAQSKVDRGNANGEQVDPLLIQAAREAKMRGKVTASEVIKGYLAALESKP